MDRVRLILEYPEELGCWQYTVDPASLPSPPASFVRVLVSWKTTGKNPEASVLPPEHLERAALLLSELSLAQLVELGGFQVYYPEKEAIIYDSNDLVDTEETRVALRDALEGLGLKTGAISVEYQKGSTGWRDLKIEVKPQRDGRV